MDSLKDIILKSTIVNSRKVINKLETLHRSQNKYELFYEFIAWSLKNNFQDFDKKYINIKKEIPTKKEIPFKFWIMWWQGEENAPILIKNNISNLKKVVGTENVIVLNQNNYCKYVNIPNSLKNKLHIGKLDLAHWSDIVRFNILNRYGGYWIDSTVAISSELKKYIESKGHTNFFTLCENNLNYHNISRNQWTLWLMGGIAHLDLFNYICQFYNYYFTKHDVVIDYFLTDDIIAHYYKYNNQFRIMCSKYKNDWKPYYWADNFDRQVTSTMFNLFESELKYSVQKLTYKVDLKELEKSNSLVSVLFSKDGYEVKG